MLNSPWLCRLVAYVLLAVGSYLAIFNTWISAIVIGQRGGLGIWGGLSIAVGLTIVELWFASWARQLTNWKPLIKAYRTSPEKTALKLCAVGLGLGLVYHFDVDSTWRSLESRAVDLYFFLWSVAWLIVGPEVTISLSEWLKGVAKQAERKLMNNNNSRDADHAFLRAERRKLMDLAERAGRDSGVRKASTRFGPKAAGEGRIDT